MRITIAVSTNSAVWASGKFECRIPMLVCAGWLIGVLASGCSTAVSRGPILTNAVETAHAVLTETGPFHFTLQPAPKQVQAGAVAMIQDIVVSNNVPQLYVEMQVTATNLNESPPTVDRDKTILIIPLLRGTIKTCVVEAAQKGDFNPQMPKDTMSVEVRLCSWIIADQITEQRDKGSDLPLTVERQIKTKGVVLFFIGADRARQAAQALENLRYFCPPDAGLAR